MTHKHIYDDRNLCFECEKEIPMNKKQFHLLAQKLIKSNTQRKAVKLHLLDGLSAYEAEKQVYGRTVATVSRDAKRIKKEYDFALTLMRAQNET